jgi:BspA type Leucine rich repeat region (6 copies)
MKRVILLLVSICIALTLSAQVTKTVSNTAGGLSAALTAGELNTVTKLIITGTIDARDFKTMRDDMPVLDQIDISGATIVAYSGTEGTNYFGSNYDYPANEIPTYAFYYPWASPAFSKTSLKSVLLPSSLISIGDQAFYGCTGLTSFTFSTPSSLTSIGNQYHSSVSPGKTRQALVAE